MQKPLTGIRLIQAYNKYKYTTSCEGLQIDAVKPKLGLQQLFNELTHLTGNSSSCIELIFTSHPNLLIE